MEDKKVLVSVIHQQDEIQAFTSPLIQRFSFPAICVDVNTFRNTRRQVDSTGRGELET